MQVWNKHMVSYNVVWMLYKTISPSVYANFRSPLIKRQYCLLVLTLLATRGICTVLWYNDWWMTITVILNWIDQKSINDIICLMLVLTLLLLSRYRLTDNYLFKRPPTTWKCETNTWYHIMWCECCTKQSHLLFMPILCNSVSRDNIFCKC